jgi:hypothetical protein
MIYIGLLHNVCLFELWAGIRSLDYTGAWAELDVLWLLEIYPWSEVRNFRLFNNKNVTMLVVTMLREIALAHNTYRAEMFGRS